MKKSKIALLCISVYLVRWLSLAPSLPADWTSESNVRFTATVIERIEYTDTNTIVKVGKWYIKMKGYAEIIPGDRVRFVGKVSPTVLGGMTTRIVMMDPIFEVVKHVDCSKRVTVVCLRVLIVQGRGRMLEILEKLLPEPMSSLAAGILLGVKGQMPTDFYTALVGTGTMHIVAASGYNVTIVGNAVIQVFSRILPKSIAIVLAITAILIYVLLSGAGASIVRAAIMGSLGLMAFYFGRPTQARRLLYIAAMTMLLIDPSMIFDVSFQLSFMATFGLLFMEPMVKKLPQISFLKEYLYPTLSATIFTLPVIWWHFGRVSYISPIVNMMVLPVVPLIMLETLVVLVVGIVSPGVAQIIAWVLYPLLWYVVEVITWWR